MPLYNVYWVTDVVIIFALALFTLSLGKLLLLSQLRYWFCLYDDDDQLVKSSILRHMKANNAKRTAKKVI